VAHPDSPELTREEPRALAVARVTVASACLAVQLQFSSGSPRLVTGAIALFVVYALAALGFRRKGRAGWNLLALIGDTVFFLFFAAFGADPGAWASSAFYSYLLLSSFLLHPWWDTLAIAWASCMFLVVVGASGQGYLLRVVLWGGILACLASLYRSKLEDRLAASTKLIRSQVELITRARDDERNKLAGDFHDGPLQGFIGLGMRLEVLRKMLERDPRSVRQELLELQDISKSQIAEMRAFLRGIRPVAVGGGGLTASLRQVVSEFQKDSGIAATFHSSDSPEAASAQASADIVQIVREALTNVQKHSRATRVATTVGRVGNSLEISAEDNGIGFPFGGSFNLDEQELLRIGPISIQKRVRTLNGQLTVESRPQRGSSIRVRIPA